MPPTQAAEERDVAVKETERLLEKCDRTQGESYRLQVNPLPMHFFFFTLFFSCVCVCINQNRNHMRMKTVFHIGARVILSLSHRFLALVNGCSISLFFERQW